MPAVIAIGFAVFPIAAQARDGDPTGAAVAQMTAGDFLWNDATGPQPATGPVRIVVSIADQKLYVYRGETLVAVSAASTGKPGHETPTGDFTILQKQVVHKSNLYDAAPMPYMQRITWDGVAIHAGRDPGYAASHGCIRVPLAFAKRLYTITRLGAQVSVTDAPVADLLPVDPAPEMDTPPAEATPETNTPVAYQSPIATASSAR